MTKTRKGLVVIDMQYSVHESILAPVVVMMLRIVAPEGPDEPHKRCHHNDGPHLIWIVCALHETYHGEKLCINVLRMSKNWFSYSCQTATQQNDANCLKAWDEWLKVWQTTELVRYNPSPIMKPATSKVMFTKKDLASNSLVTNWTRRHLTTFIRLEWSFGHSAYMRKHIHPLEQFPGLCLSNREKVSNLTTLEWSSAAALNIAVWWNKRVQRIEEVHRQRWSTNIHLRMYPLRMVMWSKQHTRCRPLLLASWFVCQCQQQ